MNAIEQQINHYTKLLERIKEKQQEANFFRDKIARILINKDINRFYRATLVKVKKHKVRAHIRNGSSYLKISERNGAYEQS